MNRIHAYLPTPDLLAARKHAKKLGISLSELIRRAVSAFLTK
jgi:hypothetical protein